MQTFVLMGAPKTHEVLRATERREAIRHAVSLRGVAEATAEIPRFARNDLSAQIASVTSLPRNDASFHALVLAQVRSSHQARCCPADSD